MHVTLTSEDLSQLSEEARGEIAALLFGRTPQAGPPQDAVEDAEYAGFDMTGVVELSFQQIQKWMAAASDQTKQGLYVFATRGPFVSVRELQVAGITNLRHFQSRTTVRTRTVTGDRDAYLLGWNDWSRAEEGEGRYAVTRVTHRSLQRYFGLA
jgi:hypothetical protein